MSAWFWQVPAAAAVPAAMYGLCWANDRGHNVERLFKSWFGGAVLLAFLGLTMWQAEGPIFAALLVGGLFCIVLGVDLHLKRRRRRR